MTSNSCCSCTGSNPVLSREDQSGNSYIPVCFDFGKEEQRQLFCLSYQKWLRCDLKFPLSICCISPWLLNFWVFWQYNSLTAWHEGGGPLPLTNLLKAAPQENDLEEKAYMHTNEERIVGRAVRSQTVHQPTLRWLYLLESTRGNQHTVVTGKVRQSKKVPSQG